MSEGPRGCRDGRAALLAWHAAATVAAPALRLLLRQRLRRGKERVDRVAERRGHGAGPRPDGRLVWIHAASVGETVSVLPVVALLVAPPFDREVLLTTATVTAAAVAAAEIARFGGDGAGARVRHRMVPFDVPRWIDRFLDGWRPDAAVFVESELWPNTIAACRRRGIPLALLNGRMSDRSARGWRRAPGLAEATLRAFSAVSARSDEDAARLRALGATVDAVADLKAGAPPLAADADALRALEARLGDRPRWLAASTHEGEERIAAAVHARLRDRHPRLLTIVAPRHPERGRSIAASLGGAREGSRARRTPVGRRALGAAPPAPDGIWIADTLGELGLLYRIAPVVFLGRSLAGDGGGQNPWEPARLGCAVVTGPGTANFRAAIAALADADAIATVDDGCALADWVGARLADPADVRARGARAAAAARRAGNAPRDAAARLIADLTA